MSEIKTFEFQVHGGETLDESGKPNWPHMVSVTLNRAAAWDLFYSLMMQLRDDEQVVRFTYVGRLAEYQEGEKEQAT